MSDTSNISAHRSQHSPSVDSSDEVNYYDPGRLDSDEGGTGPFHDRKLSNDYNNESSQYHIEELTKQRSESPDSNGKKGEKFIQLKNFAGLTGPSSNKKREDDQESYKGSLISSLSSHSYSPRNNDNYHDSAEARTRGSSNATEDEDAAQQEHTPHEVTKPHYTDEDKERMKLVFQQIFSMLMPNAASHIGLGNGSDHGGNIARENVYYRDKVKVNSPLPAKETKFKDKTRLVQTVKFHQGAIWTMKFSPCGAYLCTGGQDMNVIVWCVGNLPNTTTNTTGTTEEKEGKGENNPTTNRHSFGNNKHNTENNSNNTSSGSEYVKTFLNPTPYRIFEGHTGDIIDIAWSKSNFILSASTDKTVCLWHVSRNVCLQYFRHPDIVTAIEFHPAHDRYYISGCFDRKLRVWDIIPDGIVQEWTQTTDTITSICFSPDGKTVAGGLIQGRVYFYDLIDFDQLKYKTQMNVRNTGGKYSTGTKVTGMCYRPGNTTGLNMTFSSDSDSQAHKNWRRLPNTHIQQRPSSVQQSLQLLVSTNDNRLRLCRLDDYSLICKYRGLKNKTMQIKASFSSDGNYVICGSETGAVYIWNTIPKKKNTVFSAFSSHKNRNDGYECFDCTSSSDIATTVALFAPVDSVNSHLYHNIDVLASTGIPSTTGATGLSGVNNVGINEDHISTTTAAAAVRGAEVSGSSTSNNNIPARPSRPESVRIAADYATRVVVAADYEGCIRVFFRLS